MPSHKPLPAEPTDSADLRTNRRNAVKQAHDAALSAYSRNAFHMLDPRFSVPGIFHAYQVGEAPGQYGVDPSLDFEPYTIDMIRRYPFMNATEQLRVRWAVAAKPSWSYEELLQYRQAAFGARRTAGDNPWANVPPYDVAMIVRYPWMTPAEQLKVRYAVSQKEEWTPEELTAYRRAAFSALPFQRRGGEVGPWHLAQVGEMPGSGFDIHFPRGRYGPKQAAQAFREFGQAMEGVAGQATRAAGAMRDLQTTLPRELPSDPTHDIGRMGGWGTPNTKDIRI